MAGDPFLPALPLAWHGVAFCGNIRADDSFLGRMFFKFFQAGGKGRYE
jgi:hypothetical protein